MRYLLIFMIFFLHLYADEVQDLTWDAGETFTTFLEKNELPLKLYYDLDKEAQESLSEIKAGAQYYIMKDDNATFRQALIPISDEMQVHISKDNDNFNIDIVPIAYITKHSKIAIPVNNSPHYDISKATGNGLLANEFVASFKNSIDFRRDLKKNDKIAIIYTEKIRLGKSFSTPKIEASMITANRVEHYAFLHSDGRYYNQFGIALIGFELQTPILNARISSPFSHNRWHPVLKKYRPHYGVDYAAPTGTAVKSAQGGKVTYAGWKNGYGKVIEVEHDFNYKTLYAHLSRFANIKRGGFVKANQVIGYVGTTGVSTGPHLHFGVYKNEKAVDPLVSIKVASKELIGKDKEKFMASANSYKNSIKDILASASENKEKAKTNDKIVMLKSSITVIHD